MTAEVCISSGKAASFFVWKEQNKSVHAVFSSRDKAKIMHSVIMVPFLSFLMELQNEGEFILLIMYPLGKAQ